MLSSFQNTDAVGPDISLPQTYNESVNKYSLFSKKIIRKGRNMSKSPMFIPFGIITLIAIFVLFYTISKISGPQSTVAGTSDQKMDVGKPKAFQTLNKEFSFPLKDSNNKEVSRFKYTIQTAELRDEIIIKGQRATAIQGRTFLVLNLKITNTYDKAIQINARDYIRLVVGGSSEKLAPDIHNDPVEIQAISTKYTRLGFPVNDTDESLVLQVGEISGEKESIKLDLK